MLVVWAVQRFGSSLCCLACRSDDIIIMLIGWFNCQGGASGVSSAVVNNVGQDHGDGVRVSKTQTHEVEGVGTGLLHGVGMGHNFPQPGTNQVVGKLVSLQSVCQKRMIIVATIHTIQNNLLMVPAGGSPTINNSANDHHFLGQGSMSKGIKKIPRSSRNVDTTTWQKYIQSSLQEKLPIRSGTLNNTQVVQFLGGVGFGGSKGYLDGCNFTRGAGGKREGISEGVGNGGGVPSWGYTLVIVELCYGKKSSGSLV